MYTYLILPVPFEDKVSARTVDSNAGILPIDPFCPITSYTARSIINMNT